MVNLDSKVKHSLTVFPNPSNDKFTALINQWGGGNVKLSLLTLFGKVIRQAEFEVQGQTLNVEFGQDLSSGIYILKAEIEGETFIRRIMKE